MKYCCTSLGSNSRLSLKLVWTSLIVLASLFATTSVLAFPSFLSQFTTKYGKAGSRLNTCGLCHEDFSSGKRNPYGKDFKDNLFNFDVIEMLDSDGDGTNNIDEITGDYMPGYTCDTVGNTTNGPPDLSTFVEPGGCAGNTAPVANAGPDQTAQVGDTVTLDGSGSSDADGDPLTYRWEFLSKPLLSTATLSDPTAVKPTLVIDLPGIYSLQLIVNDGTTDSAPDFVNITTVNSPPVANAGPDQSVSVGDLVQLDGSGSTDVDGDALTYSWSFMNKPAGSTATLSDPSAVMPTFTADVAGSYVVTLTVNDGTVDSPADAVTITAGIGNTPPVANAGPDQMVIVGNSVLLDGSGSMDADGDPLTYAWSLITKPAGSMATLSDPAAIMPTFTADLPGMYVAQLIVNDGTVDSAPDTVTITTEAGNTAPMAEAGPDQTVMVGETVMLDGSGSMDADGDPLTYAWSFVSKPMGSTASLSDPTAVKPTFVADIAGMYVVQLIVNDGTVDSAPDTVTIQARGMNQQGELMIEKAQVSPKVKDIDDDDHHDAKEEKHDHDNDKDKHKKKDKHKDDKKGKQPKEFKLKVKGKGAPAGGMVTVSDAITGTILGVATANEDGKWKLKVKIKEAASVPCRVRAEYDDQYDEKEVKHAPPSCSGGAVPPMPDMDEDDDDHKANDHDKDGDDHSSKEKEDDDD